MLISAEERKLLIKAGYRAAVINMTSIVPIRRRWSRYLAYDMGNGNFLEIPLVITIDLSTESGMLNGTVTVNYGDRSPGEMVREEFTIPTVEKVTIIE